MGWEDRVIEGFYTSPSGIVAPFFYENVAVGFDKKTAAFNFPDFNGTYIQDLGHTGRRYPMRLFFSGADYDEEIDVFLELLREPGIGELNHPFYGTIKVVPFGQINRKDDLKTAGNQGILELTFFETVDLLFPLSQVDAPAQIDAAIADFNDAQALEFSEALDVENVSDENSFKSKYLATIAKVKSSLRRVSEAQAAVQKLTDDVFDSINLGIDTLIGDPLALAFQTSILLQTPARAFSLISDKLDAYSNLLSSIIGSDPTTRNDYLNQNLSASAAVTGAVISAVNAKFLSRPEAIAAAESILAQLDALVAWQDAAIQSLVFIDTGGAYQQLKQTVSLAAGALITISFNLAQERTITLDRDRTILDLSADLYGEIEDKLDFLITTNNLSGDEVIELKRGREIAYFV